MVIGKWFRINLTIPCKMCNIIVAFDENEDSWNFSTDTEVEWEPEPSDSIEHS